MNGRVKNSLGLMVQMLPGAEDMLADVIAYRFDDLVSSFKLCIFFTVFNKSVEVIAIILTVPFLATALIILSSDGTLKGYISNSDAFCESLKISDLIGSGLSFNHGSCLWF